MKNGANAAMAKSAMAAFRPRRWSGKARLQRRSESRRRSWIGTRASIRDSLSDGTPKIALTTDFSGTVADETRRGGSKGIKTHGSHQWRN